MPLHFVDRLMPDCKVATQYFLVAEYPRNGLEGKSAIRLPGLVDLPALYQGGNLIRSIAHPQVSAEGM